MVTLVRITAVLLLLSHHYAVKEVLAAIPWNYEEDGSYGPSHWPSLFPNYCNGSRQSPIDIPTNSAVDLQLSTNYSNTLILTGYNATPQQPFQLLDNGHSVQVNVVTKSMRATGASLMNGNYTLDQFHFHWGTTTCNEGSEHRIDGKAYPAEIHLVHYNSDLYASFSEAVSSNNEAAVTVFGVFVDVAAGSTSAELDAIISNISSIPEEGNTANVVIWNVFEQPIYITMQQLEQFRTVKGEAHMNVDENFRPTQPLNGRVVSWFNMSAPSGVTSCYSNPSLANTDCSTSTAKSMSTTKAVNIAAVLRGQKITAVLTFILSAFCCLARIIH